MRNIDPKGYFKQYISNITDHTIAYLGDVRSQHQNTLTYALDQHYFGVAINNPHVNTIITTQEVFEQHPNITKNIIISASPKVDFWQFHNYLVKNCLMELPLEPHIDQSATIHPKAIIDAKVSIGKNVRIDAGAVILRNTILDDNVHIHSNAIIGSDGMQTVKDTHGNEIFIEHAGGVYIGKNVNILAGANVSKSVGLEFTTIGDNTVISLLSSVGHNAKIGKNCLLAGNVLIGGSAIIEDNVWIGPSSTIKDGIHIHKNAKVRIGSVVVKNVKADAEVSGNFAYSHASHIKNYLKAQR